MGKLLSATISGNCHFVGSGSVPLLSINNSGHMSAASAAALWDNLSISLNTLPAITGLTSDSPDFTQFLNDGAGSEGIYAWHFDASAVESLNFSVQIPHGYALGTNIEPHIHWCPSTSGADDVVWGLEYTIADVSGVFGNTTILSAADSTLSAAYQHFITDLGTIPGSALSGTISTTLICRLFRNASGAGDTYADDAIGLAIDFHYLKDTLGSRQEYIK